MAIMAALEAGEVSPTAAEAGLPLGRDGETWMAIMAAQKVAKASPTAMEAGLSPGKDGDNVNGHHGRSKGG